MECYDKVSFTKVDGPRRPKRVDVFALSTCGFCERALQWLKTAGIAHGYAFIDQMDPDFKRQLKLELKEKFGSIPVYPLLVLDQEQAVSGFTPEKYQGLFGEES